MIRTIYKKVYTPTKNLLLRVQETFILLTNVRIINMAYYPTPHTLIEVFNDSSIEVNYRNQQFSWVRPLFDVPASRIVTQQSNETWIFYHTPYAERRRYKNFSLVENDIIDKEGVFFENHQVILL